MILQQLTIKHYKRYRDQTIEFPSAGIFGIVGANGAGKSTFFETILWTLFGPQDARITATDVTPRALKDARAKTEVALTVETADAVYTIVRKLSANGRTAEAEIFRGEEAQPFVQGVREVNRFVRGTLLRMTPAAFATTFFTRQKDLSFFADLSNPGRVREMQRLLDLDALELAHERFRVERRDADARFRQQRNYLEQETGARDFAAETAEAEAAEAVARADQERLTAQFAALRAEHDHATVVLAQLDELHTRHLALDAERAHIERAREGARATAEAARGQLARLETIEREAEPLIPEAARLPDAATALRDADAARAHAEHVVAARADLRTATSNRDTLARGVDELIGTLDPLRDLLWTWDDVRMAPAGLPRARALADALAPTATMLAERVADRDALTRLQTLAADAQAATDAAKSRANAIAQLDARLNVVLAAGDPAISVDALTREERALSAHLTRQETELKALRAERKRFADLLGRWQQANADEPCPTCGRAFTPEDAEVAFTSLRDSIARCEREGKALAATLEETRAAGREINRRLQADSERLRQRTELAAQREQAARQATDAEASAEAALRALREALKAAGRRTPPTDAELGDVTDELDLLHTAARATEQVIPMMRRLEAAETQVAEREAALAALGPDTYDPAAHAAAREEHTRLVALAAQLRQVRAQLAARPEIAAQRDEALGSVAAADAHLARIAEQTAATGFDPDALAAARADEAALRQQVAALGQTVADARVALTEATRETRERKAGAARIAALRDEVARLEADASRLNLMTRGFADFSAELSARIRPRLADNASDLIERMTNGHYSRMEFNDSYVPLLYNDAQQKFPISKFSGGEQDVAALAARIALAQLLAERGGYRIGFMVLDEVFGSLDSERRGTVLDALAALREVVPQLFIVSHVDDVRLSPVMDEVWTVVAAADGTSEVHRRDLPALLGTAA